VEFFPREPSYPYRRRPARRRSRAECMRLGYLERATRQKHVPVPGLPSERPGELLSPFFSTFLSAEAFVTRVTQKPSVCRNPPLGLHGSSPLSTAHTPPRGHPNGLSYKMLRCIPIHRGTFGIPEMRRAQPRVQNVRLSSCPRTLSSRSVYSRASWDVPSNNPSKTKRSAPTRS
jgi:hypothetical protein